MANILEITFPQYRKYAHNRSFFKIFSVNEFEQINIIGKSYLIEHYTATIHPERIFIQDMLYNINNNWEESNEEEYSATLEMCKKSLIEIKF